MKWLGHIIDQHGLRADPAKTKVISEYPVPENEKELRRFLGMANYYRKFIKNYAILASPLYDLTRKGCFWRWEKVHNDAFQELKRLLYSTDVLCNPDFSAPYVLYTDASDNGMGAVLCQFQRGEERPIAFASQHFSPREKKYSTIEKEAAAVIWALKKFHVYLWGARFSVKSDHAPLKWLYNRRDATGRLGRWQACLLEYTGLEGIDHVKGQDSIVADALSRIPTTTSLEELMTPGELMAVNISTNELKIAQIRDSQFTSLRSQMVEENGIWKKDGKVFIPEEKSSSEVSRSSFWDSQDTSITTISSILAWNA
jgi:hypothetical protein